MQIKQIVEIASLNGTGERIRRREDKRATYNGVAGINR